MKYVASAVALAVSAGTAGAAALDRSGMQTGIIFESGNYAELSFGSVNPSVSGTYAAGAFDSGDIAPSYTQMAFGVKTDLTETLSIALIYDQPWGANVDYSGSTFAGTANSTAELKSDALTALLKYQATDNVSVYGGITAQWVEMAVGIPALAAVPAPGVGVPYSANGDRTMATGYVLGAAYEIPEIAFRAALTYHSQTEFDISTTETSNLGANRVSNTNVIMPESVNLDFQTGIMADTLLLASFRWANWAQTNIDPADYQVLAPAAGAPAELLKYDAERVTWSLGVGRRFTEKWSGSAIVGWEPKINNVTGNLGPTDGFTSLSLAAVYTGDNYKVTTGIRYVEIGDATARGAGGVNGNFSDNSAIAVGVRLGFSF